MKSQVSKTKKSRCLRTQKMSSCAVRGIEFKKKARFIFLINSDLITIHKVVYSAFNKLLKTYFIPTKLRNYGQKRFVHYFNNY